MKSVVSFSIRQAVFVNVVFVILTIAGAFSLYSIPLENMPDVDIGKVFIYTSYYGASPDDVEQLVTMEIEDALDDLEEMEFIQSASYRNFSSIQVKFNDDSDYEDLYDELRFRALNIKDQLPDGADDPSFTYIDTHVWKPVIMVNLCGDLPQKTLKLLADKLKADLAAVPGIQNVEIFGEFKREFHVSVDPERLRTFGVTFHQVSQAVSSANLRIPTGRFVSPEGDTPLDAGRCLASQKEVLDVIVRKDGDGNFIRVRDLVTSARMSHRDPTVIPSANGRDTLRLKVLKQSSANSVDVAAAVKKISRRFEKVHRPDGVEVVFTNDSTFEINDSVQTLGGNLKLGLSLVFLLLWGTLGFRNALLTSVGIPFAFLCSLIIMQIAGVSLNTITLFAFVLVTGIMVDDAVIIMENIFRHLQMGKPRKEAVIDGTSEVMIPVVSSALTTVLAFLPMLIMSGSTGEFFSYIPKTVTYALIASLFEALFILPIHVLDWGPRIRLEKIVDEDEDPYHHLRSGVFAPFWKIYHPLVRWLLDHKTSAFTGLGILFAGAMAILILSVMGIKPLIKVKFFPGNYFRYHVAIAMPPGTAIQETDRVVRDISEYIVSLGRGQAESASGDAGFYEDQDYQRWNGVHYGQVVVSLPEDRDRDFPENPANDPMKHLGYIRKKLRTFADEHYAAAGRPDIKVFEEGDGPPTGKPVNIRISAGLIQDAIRASDRILDFMRSSPELADLVDLDDDRAQKETVIKFRPRPEAVYEYALMPGQVTAMVAGALSGTSAGRYRDTDEEVDLLVRLARVSDPGNPQRRGLARPLDILDVPIVEHASAPVLLRDLVEARHEREPNRRNRYKGQPTITITASLKPGTTLSAQRVQLLVNRYFREHRDRLFGATISYGGEFESTSRSYTSLIFAFFIAVLLIYMVLASQFNHYVQPVIIITAVPFALIGVVLGLFLTRTIFTIGSFMAIVGLAGIAVNDSLILIDFMNVRYKKGRPLREAVVEACAARMRPVLITTITTILGLLPMAIGIPGKSISWAPMATSFVAGLCSATFLALLMIPVQYEAFEQLKARLSGISDQKNAPLAEKPSITKH
ncbi:MAG: acriflavin resistance protein [Desulfobacterales bacterium]|nr:MAG: acriflavin resistance protein [Desulfobacterales bacterium]